MTTLKGLKASIVLVTQLDGRRVEQEVIRSGKKITVLKNISAGYDCKPCYYSTESIMKAIETGTYKIII
jgi:hypothetical protein